MLKKSITLQNRLASRSSSCELPELTEGRLVIRRAFELVKAKQRRKYAKVIALVSTLFLLAGGYALYLQIETARQKDRAQANLLRHEVAGNRYSRYTTVRP